MAKRLNSTVIFRVKSETLKALQDMADRQDKDLSDLLRDMVQRGLKADRTKRSRENEKPPQL